MRPKAFIAEGRTYLPAVTSNEIASAHEPGADTIAVIGAKDMNRSLASVLGVMREPNMLRR